MVKEQQWEMSFDFFSALTWMVSKFFFNLHCCSMSSSNCCFLTCRFLNRKNFPRASQNGFHKLLSSPWALSRKSICLFALTPSGLTWFPISFLTCPWINGLLGHYPSWHPSNIWHYYISILESEEELRGLLMKVKEESVKVGLRLNIQKTKIMASGPIKIGRASCRERV